MKKQTEKSGKSQWASSCTRGQSANCGSLSTLTGSNWTFGLNGGSWPGTYGGIFILNDGVILSCGGYGSPAASNSLLGARGGNCGGCGKSMKPIGLGMPPPPPSAPPPPKLLLPPCKSIKAPSGPIAFVNVRNYWAALETWANKLFS